MPTARSARLLGLLLVAGCECSETIRKIPPQLVLREEALDFGAVPVGETVTRALRLSAGSATPLELTVRVVSEDGAFALAADPPSRLAGREDFDLLVSFTPPVEGVYGGTLVVESDDPDPSRGVRHVLLGGQGLIPRIAVAPESLGLTAVACPATALSPSCADQARLTIENAGDVTLRLGRVELRGTEGGALPEGLRLGRKIEGDVLAPGARLEVVVHWKPTPAAVAGGETAHLVELVIPSADPERPEVIVPVSAVALPDSPPVACIRVVRVERRAYRLDENGEPELGLEEVPEGEWRHETLTTLIRVQPGMTVFLSSAECTSDPEGDALSLRWAVAGPSASRARLSSDRRAEVSLEVDAAGLYEVSLTATDGLGQTGRAALQLDAVPRVDLFAQLSWQEDSAAPGVPDLDLHLLWEPATLFCVRDCFFFNPSPNWFAQELASDDPRLLRDDQGTAGRLESIVLREVPPAGATFRVAVHYWEVAGAASRAVTPTVTVRAKGTEHSFTASAPLNQPGEVWFPARIAFRNDGTVEVTADGTRPLAPQTFTGAPLPQCGTP